MKKFLLAVAAVAMSLTASADVFLAGGFNGWSMTETQLEENNGVYTTTIEKLTTEFKVVIDGAWYGSNDALELGTPLVVAEGNDYGNINFAGGLAMVENATVSFDLAKLELTITGQQAEATVTYGIHGDFATGEWATVDMTNEGNLWTATFEALENASGNFGIKQLTEGNQTAWFSCPKGAEYLTISGAVNNVLCASSDNENFVVSGLTGNWDFVFDAEALTLTVKEAKSGIETIAAENAAAVYYNLNGVRVANPANGLFIVKQGNKVCKVIL